MSRRLRVLQVLEATEGGTRTHLRDLVTHLDPARFAIEVASNAGREPGFADDLALFRSRGVVCHQGPLVRQLEPRADLAAGLWLRQLVGERGYDVVHTHSSKAGFVGRWAARLAGVPVRLYTPNAFRFQAPDAGARERRVVIALERLAARWGTGLICVSQGERQAALAARIAPAQALHLIPNGLDLPALATSAAVGDGAARLGLRPGERAVLTVGRRVAQKGDCYLLAAWPSVLRRCPEARLVLVGGGPLEDALRAQAAALGVTATVRFLPTQPAVAALYPAAAVYCLPSLYEGCPYPLLEALALGCPAVATAVAGSREILGPDARGLLVPPADPPALAAALGRLLTDRPLASRLAVAGRAYVQRHHTAAAMARQVAALYQRTR
ncbi:MAG: glycosyltransferase [Fimbriimonadaceae bacterium]|nr:glycosyltransferase [Fimbriimonadaceae bacterium]